MRSMHGTTPTTDHIAKKRKKLILESQYEAEMKVDAIVRKTWTHAGSFNLLICNLSSIQVLLLT